MYWCIEENGSMSDQLGPSTLFTIKVISSNTLGQLLDLSAVYCTPTQTRRIRFYGATGADVANLISDAFRPGMTGVDASFMFSVVLEAGPTAVIISLPRKNGLGFLESLNARLEKAVVDLGVTQGPIVASFPSFGNDTLDQFNSFSEAVNQLAPNGDLHVFATPFCSDEEGVIRVALFF